MEVLVVDTGRDSPGGVGYGAKTGHKDPQLPPGVKSGSSDIKTKEDEKKAAKEQKIRQKKFKQEAKAKAKKNTRYKKWYDAQTKKAINKSALDMYGRIEQYMDDPMDGEIMGLSQEEIAGLMAKDPSLGYDFSGLDKGKEKLGSNIGTPVESWRENLYTVNPNTSYGILQGLLDKTRPDTRVTAQNTLDAARQYVAGATPKELGGEGWTHKESR